MYRNKTEYFQDSELDELMREEVLVGYILKSEEDYQTLKLTLKKPGHPNEVRTITIRSNGGCDGSSYLSVDTF